MAFKIEQDSAQVKLARSFQSRADIDSIRLLDATLACKMRAEDAAFPLTFGLRFKAQETVLEGTQFTVPVKLGVKVVNKEGAGVLTIGCRFQADYKLAPGYQPSSEEIEAFKQGNAIFNCWPYFREFVQSTLVRMNYPPLTVPFLRLVPKPPQQAIAETPTQEPTPPALPTGSSGRETGDSAQKPKRRKRLSAR